MPHVLETRPADPTALGWIPTGARLSSGIADRRARTGEQLRQDAAALAASLQRHFEPGSVIGSLAENSPAWLVLDLAVQAAGMVHVPLPSFFSEAQIQHAVHSSSMNGLICSDPALAARMGFDVLTVQDIKIEESDLVCYRSAGRPRTDRFVAIPRTVSKMTFTSGTTATPKAVLLTHAQQLGTARSLAEATRELGIRRHLCLLPLPVLLENVAGAYTALLTGAECIVPSMSAVGMTGASHFDAQRCLETIVRERADSIIVLPQMLAALVAMLESGTADVRPETLKLVAVGGAHTPETLIRRGRSQGLPVYEGYGLSECASVTTLNLPGADRVGTVGRPLPGVAVRLDDDSEIQVCGRGFEGYLGAPGSQPPKWFATGDIGRVDADGFVSIIGRKKHVLVTSFGRNVSPEWPEGRLTTCPGISQAAVFGDARPYLCAVIVAASGLDDAHIDAHIAAVNADLPDYARVRHWIRALESFTPINGLATANGRPRRAVIETRYADALNAAYARQSMPTASPPARASTL